MLNSNCSPSGHSNNNSVDTITLAGGCFWCIEAAFQNINGVVSSTSGYMGGKVKNPTYREVCSGETGHAEVVQVVFNPEIVSIESLLDVFFTVHDPTSLNRQGADVGTQYRSAIFYHNQFQKDAILKYIKSVELKKVFESPIITEVVAATDFYIAEKYHQNYYNSNKAEGYCQFVIKPKLDKLYKFKNELIVK